MRLQVALGFVCAMTLIAPVAGAQAAKVEFTPMCRVFNSEKLWDPKAWAVMIKQFKDPASPHSACLRAQLAGQFRFADQTSNLQNGYSPMVNAVRGQAKAAEAQQSPEDRCMALSEVVAAYEAGQAGSAYKTPKDLFEWVPPKREQACDASKKEAVP